MKRKSVVVLLLIVIVLIYILVHTYNKSIRTITLEESSPLEERKTTIAVAIESRLNTKTMKSLIQQFNDNSKDIVIDVLEVPDRIYNDTLNMLLTSGKGPDVFYINDVWLTGYVFNNWLKDMGNIIDDNFLKAYPGWVKEFADNQMFNGKRYTVPSSAATFRLIYNNELFKLAGLTENKPPKTFGELKKYSRLITKAGTSIRKYGFALPIGEEWNILNSLVEIPNSLSGKFYYNYKDKAYDLSVYKDLLIDIKSMKLEGTMFPMENSLTIDTVISQFSQGNVGMTFLSSRDLLKLLERRQGNVSWGVGLPPLINDGTAVDGGLQMVPDMIFGVNASSKKEKAAVEVWKYLYSEHFLGNLYKSGSIIPLSNQVSTKEEFIPLEELVHKFLPGKEDSFYKVTPLYDDAWFRAKAYKEALAGVKDVDMVLKDYTEQLNRVLSSKKRN